MRNFIKNAALSMFLVLGTLGTALSQSVGLNNATPDASSILDLTATDRGLLVPRMTTTQRTTGIASPATGLLVYDTDLSEFYFYNGATWAAVGSGSIDGNGIYDGSGSLTVATVVTQGANTLDFTSTVVDGFSVDGTTFSVDALNNRVGLGTAAPAEKFHVINDGISSRFARNSTQYLEIQTDIGGQVLRSQSAVSNAKPLSLDATTDDANTTPTGGSNGIIFTIRGSEKMRVDDNGNVGIGISAPGNLLHVHNPSTVGKIEVSGSGLGTTRAEFVADRVVSARGGGMRVMTGSTTDWWIGTGYNGGGATEDLIIDNDDTYSNGAHFTIKDGTGNVGIGTTTPAQKLDVAGTAQVTGFKLTTSPTSGYVLSSDAAGVGTWTDPTTISDGDWTVSGNYVYNTTDSIGIGTANPLQKLDVRGSADFGDGITQTVLFIKGASTGNEGGEISLRGSTGFINKTFDSYQDHVRLFGSSTTDFQLQLFNTGTGKANLRVTGDGYFSDNVGIGTTTPARDLHIHSGSTSTTLMQITTSITGSTSTDGLRIGVIGSSNEASIWNYENGVLIFGTNNTLRMTISSAGNVGIGTLTPDGLLDVEGGGIYLSEIAAPATPAASKGVLYEKTDGKLYFKNDGGVESDLTQGGGTGGWTDGGANVYLTTSTDDVGIGTTTPAARLEIDGGDWDNSLIITTTGVGSAGPGLTFNATNKDWNIMGTNPADAAGDQKFAILDNSLQPSLDAYRFIIDASGNVGIGDVTPDGKLEVRKDGAGDILNLYDTTANVLSVLAGGDLWSDATTTFYVDASADAVGIGDATPDGKLEVRQTGTADILNLYDGAVNVLSVLDGGDLMVDATTTFYVDASTNRVGIGTSAPSYKLHVTGGAAGTSAAYFNSGSSASGHAVKGNGINGPTAGYLGAQGGTDFNGITTADWAGQEIGVVGISTGGSSTDNFGVLGHSNYWGMRAEHSTSGNSVNLGGTSFAMQIVDGNQAAGYILSSDASGNATWADPATLPGGNWTRSGNYVYNTTDSIGIGTASPLGVFHVNNDVTGSDSSFVILKNGRVGIGKINPWTKVEVVGDIAVGYGDAYIVGAYDGLSWNSSTGSVVLGSKVAGNNLEFNAGSATTRMVVSAGTGNLGIGTSSPGSKLDVSGDVNILSTTAHPLVIRATVDGYGTLIRESDDGFDAIGLFGYASRGRIYINSGGTTTIELDGSGVSYFNGGNVGIGTASPGAQLEVAGQVKITGGTPGANKVLTSDAAGLASWVSPLWTDYTTYIAPNSNTTARVYDINNANGIRSNNAGGGSNAKGFYGYMSSGTAGTGYGQANSRSGVQGYAYFGYAYTFGVSGYRYNDAFNRGGGVFGGSSQNNPPIAWGSLGYRNSGGTHYGVYGTTAYASGSGGKGDAGSWQLQMENAKQGMDNEPHINIGLGAWGDLFGSDIHGRIYGAYIEGGRYALYTHGDNYTDGLDIHLVDVGEEKMGVFYTSVSSDASMMANGVGTLVNGKATIKFDDTFSASLSGDDPVIVTVTPIGSSKNIYLESSNKRGFTVVDDANSNVQFNWIAIGKRAGSEFIQIRDEVIRKDFTEKIAEGLHNDSDTENDGSGLYFENGELFSERHVSTQANVALDNVKKQFTDNPETNTYEGWKNIFAGAGGEIGMSKDSFEGLLDNK